MGFPACLFTKGKGDYSGDESAVLPMEGFHSGDIRLPRSSGRFWEDLAKEVRGFPACLFTTKRVEYSAEADSQRK